MLPIRQSGARVLAKFGGPGIGVIALLGLTQLPRPAEFEIHGATLSIGMKDSELSRVLSKVGLHGDKIAQPCLKDYLASHKRQVSISTQNGHCVRRVSWTSVDGDFSVTFVEDFPLHPGTSVAASISWIAPTNRPGAFDSVMNLNRSLGPPSVTDGQHPWRVATWCLGFRCANIELTPREERSGAILYVHRGLGATLTDDEYANKHVFAVYNALRDHGISLTE